jgi:hypothetical protein
MGMIKIAKQLPCVSIFWYSELFSEYSDFPLVNFSTLLEDVERPSNFDILTSPLDHYNTWNSRIRHLFPKLPKNLEYDHIPRGRVNIEIKSGFRIKPQKAYIYASLSIIQNDEAIKLIKDMNYLIGVPMELKSDLHYGKVKYCI